MQIQNQRVKTDAYAVQGFAYKEPAYAGRQLQQVFDVKGHVIPLLSEYPKR